MRPMVHKKSARSAIEITPKSTLRFIHHTLGLDSSKCVVILRHAEKTTSRIAFKVKTANRRRYLVQPTQGLIAPGQTRTLIIRLHPDEKICQRELNNPTDKFLLQSCVASSDLVIPESIPERNNSQELRDFWARAENSGEIYNQKLRADHEFIKDELSTLSESDDSQTGVRDYTEMKKATSMTRAKGLFTYICCPTRKGMKAQVSES
mmetsp:Transcript_33623/g.41182  ORF Transcript_33623/g.41182 Transcript_33623/m.41182 type:complete len:207 (-) Transcript_33623:232-852(-)